MRKIAPTLLVLFVSFVTLIAQPPSYSRARLEGASKLPNANYFALDTLGEQWYSTHPDDTSEMTGSLEYLRWQSFWQFRVTHEDSIPGYFRYAHQAVYQQSQTPFNCAGNNGSNWICLGPFSPSVSSTGGYNRNGRMDCIASYPGNPNIVFAGSLHSGLWKTTNFNSASPTWTNVTDYLNLAGLGASGIVIDPLVNSGGFHTIWISTASYRFDFAFYGIGVLRSVDGGTTWQQTGLSPLAQQGMQTFDIILDISSPVNSRTLFAMVNKYIYRSVDDGVSWTVGQATIPAIVGNGYGQDIQMIDADVHPTNSNIVYASTNGPHSTFCLTSARYYRSTDGGQNFQDLTQTALSPAPTLFFEWLEVETTPANPNVVYIMGFSNGNDGNFYRYIYKSTDAGINFALVSIGTTPETNQMVVSQNDENVLYFFDGIRMFRSIDGGVSNCQVNNASAPYYHSDVRSIFIEQATAGGVNDLVYFTTDGGITTVQFSSPSSCGATTVYADKNGIGLNITQFYGLDIAEEDPDYVVAGAQDNHQMRLLNGTWSQVGGVGDGQEVLFNDNCYTTGYYGRANTGITNLPIDYMNNSFTGSVGVFPLLNQHCMVTRPMYFDRDNDYIYTGYADITRRPAFCPQNNTGSWQLVSNFSAPPWNMSPVRKITSFDINERDRNTIYCSFYAFGPTRAFFKTNDGGATWTDLTGGLSALQYHIITDIVTDPSNANKIWVTLSGFANNVGENRVYYSSDGGATWNDASSGLSNFPTNCIVYEKGTNDGLYLGTDMGVFYHNATMSNPYWVCYSQNIPPSAYVIDLEISYCAKTITAATYGRSIWQSNLSPSSQSVPITYPTNATLIGRKLFNCDLVVVPGTTLTISGSTTEIDMTKGHKIIVQRGGKLIVDGAKITSACNDFWKGIEVWGTPTQPQGNTSSNGQGTVTIINGATIENAEVGVAATRFDATGLPDFQYGGGIIRAVSANFRNNITATQLWAYHGSIASNFSYFKNCNFETDANWLNNTVYPKSFVDLYEVDRVSLLGCSFKNTAPGNFPVGNQGTGIFSVDAMFRVADYCPTPICNNPVSSSFQNLTYGVNGSASMPILNCNVDKSTFTNCDKGVSLRGIDYCSTTRCQFTISPGGLTTPHFGIYYDNCSGFQVDQNTFTGTGIPGYNVGIVIRDSRDRSNLVYNNTLDNLHVALEALGDNDGGNMYDGLRFNCNDMTNNLFDVFVTNATNQNSITTDIGRVQGQLDVNSPNPKQLVRNTYSATCVGTNENQYRVTKTSPSPIIHEHHTTVSTLPQCKDGLVATTQRNYTFSKAQDCPSSFAVVNNQSTLRQLLITYTNNIAAQKALVDGNSTASLLSVINTGSPGQIKNTLLAAGPYLSDQVLIAAIQHNLPPGTLKEIIVPNSPVTPEVMTVLNGIGLPNGIRNQINAAQTGMSPRGKLEMHISQLQYERDVLLSERIRMVLNDTTILHPMDTVIKIIKSENIPDQKCKLASAYVTVKDFVKADSLLDAMEIQEPLDNFCQLTRILIELRQAVNGCLALHTDTVKTILLENFALHKEEEGCAQAHALLIKAFSSLYLEDVVFPESENAQRQSPEENQLEEHSDFKAYPNPASDNILVEYKLSESELPTSLVIIDATGREIIRQELLSDQTSVLVDISLLANGLYIWRVENDSKVLHSDKFSVIK